MQTPFIGPSYNLESRPASVQRTINMIPVPLEPGNERAPWVFKDVPGLVALAQPPNDPYFSSVLFLANGAGLTTDSSSYAWTFTSAGSIALNSTFPLNGRDTYYVPPSGVLNNGDGAAIMALIGSGEWCDEFYIRYVSASFGIEGNIAQFPIGITSVTPSRTVRYIQSGGGTVLDLLTPSTFGSGAFHHITIIRDNTTNAVYARYHIAINGTVVATSTEPILKTEIESQSANRLMGFDVNSPTHYIGGRRFTRNTRRYLTNSQGGAMNTFTPDPYPFIVGD